MLPDLNRLKVFYHVYKHRSVLKASKELHVTQSAVSQGLKHLEEEMGVLLFQRTRKSFVPTPEGEKLHQTLLPFLQQLQLTVRSFQRGKSEPEGLLRIGAPVGTGATQLIDFIAHYREKNPKVQFDLHLGLPPRILKYILNSKVDFAIVDKFEELSTYPVEIQRLIDLDFICVGHKALAQSLPKGFIQFEQLIKLPFVTYLLRDSFLNSWFNYHFGKSPERLNVVLRADHIQAMVRGVLQKLGIAILPRNLVESELKAGHLIEIRLEKKPYANPLVLIRHKSHMTNYTQDHFIKALLDSNGKF